MSHQLRLVAIELGATESGRGVIEELRSLHPGIWISGVEKTSSYSNSVFDEVITTQREAFFGSYSLVDTASLSVTPELHHMLAPFEGKMLNMAGLAATRSVLDYPEPTRGIPVFSDSYDSRKDLLDRHARFWNFYLESRKIDAVIHENLGQEFYDFVALQVARCRGIPTLVFNVSPYFPRTLFVQEHEHDLGTLDLGRRLKQAIDGIQFEDPNFIRRSVGNFDWSPDARIGTNATSVTYKTSPLVSWIFDRSIYQNEISPRSLLAAITTKLNRGLSRPRHRLKVIQRSRALVRATRASIVEEQRFAKQPTFDLPYIFLPLHYQPETSTSIKARHFYVFREAIAFLASELPSGWRLVVKEHPHQFRRLLSRTKGFYAQIAAISNVLLVSHTSNNSELVNNARGIACLSQSSIAAYASFTGKPVISLGDSQLRAAPNFYCVQTTGDLKAAMNIVAKWDEADLDLRRDLGQKRENFLNNLQEATFEGEFGDCPDGLSAAEWERTKKATRFNISKAIHEWLKLKSLSI